MIYGMKFDGVTLNIILAPILLGVFYKMYTDKNTPGRG